ncbi:ABC transporter permease [Porphyromonas loveana]|uniref:ABC transporter permease n=1 Tax=Porphyromonas loveana TaxID=1884669 RepID=UPI0035A0F012
MERTQVSGIRLFLLRFLPCIIFLALWELFVYFHPDKLFYYGAPSKIVEAFCDGILRGSLLIDFSYTFIEALLGFIIGNVLGVLMGLLLWFSNTVFKIAKPYIVMLGSAPIFALAPLMMIWFGTGMLSKVMMAVLSTVFIALYQAYSGALNVNPHHVAYLKSWGAEKSMIFRKIIVPSSMVWVISAFRINVGFALLGAFMGEYISSSAGLGHLIKVQTGLFNISQVLLGVIMMVAIALILNALVMLVENPLKKLLVKVL